MIDRFDVVTATCSCLFLSATALAADDPISANRPDFSESTDVVAAGVVQLELGGELEHDSHGPGYVDELTTPLQLRIGLNDRVELQFTTDGYTRSKERVAGRSDVANGYADTSLGLKVALSKGEESSGTPAIAALVQVDIDSGSAAFRGNDVRPSLRVPVEWSISDESSISLMPVVTYDADERHRFFTGGFAVSVETSWSDAWGGFAEAAAEQLAHSDDGGDVVTLRSGVTYLASDDLLLDAVLTRGANSNTANWAAGAGLAFRF